jgi:hypothetical protein
MKKLVASFHGGTKNYLAEYQEYNKLCMRQFADFPDVEVKEKNDQESKIQTENS